MKKSIITIAGTLGSGKSSTAKIVAKELGYTHFSTGDLLRRLGAERGLEIVDTNLAAEKMKELDAAVDDENRRIAREGADMVMDSRLAFHFIPDSFKVFLTLDTDTAAERILHQINTEGRIAQTASTKEEVVAEIKTRRASEVKRYINLYNVNIDDMANYDLVIDTKNNDLETVVRMVLDAYNAWKMN
jgi:cytidylate kinase